MLPLYNTTCCRHNKMVCVQGGDCLGREPVSESACSRSNGPVVPERGKVKSVVFQFQSPIQASIFKKL